MDPTNPVVKLCAEGMQAEQNGDMAGAKRLFEQAWQARTNAYDACVAAHYVARHADGPQASLEWNTRCLQLANEVGDERVTGFYPSLYLNIGRSHEELGDLPAARLNYQLAAAEIDKLGQDPYGDILRDGITRALERTDTLQSDTLQSDTPQSDTLQ